MTGGRCLQERWSEAISNIPVPDEHISAPTVQLFNGSTWKHLRREAECAVRLIILARVPDGPQECTSPGLTLQPPGPVTSFVQKGSLFPRVLSSERSMHEMRNPMTTTTLSKCRACIHPDQRYSVTRSKRRCFKANTSYCVSPFAIERRGFERLFL